MLYDFLFIQVIVQVTELHFRKQHKIVNHFSYLLWTCVRNFSMCVAVGGWPCVLALLSVDNIVLGSRQTEGTWRYEIILWRDICSPDTEGVTLFWNIPPRLLRALPALSNMYSHSVVLHCIYHEPQSPFMHVYQKPSKHFHPPFVLFPHNSWSALTTSDWFPWLVYCTEHHWVIFIIFKHLKTCF